MQERRRDDGQLHALGEMRCFHGPIPLLADTPPWPSGQSSGSAFSLSSTRGACRRVRSTGSCSTSLPSRVFGQLRLIAPSDWTPFLTNIFLHAGWLHLILNMWTLWTFGPAVEDRLGPGRFTQGRVVRAMQDDGAPVRGGGALARTPCPPGQARHRGRTADCRPLRDPRHSHHDPVQERQGNREDERCNACRADSAVGAVARLEFTGIGLTCAMPSGEEGQEHAWRDRIY